MWLIVGLGNPGAKYARNRHNVGFHIVDKLASDAVLGSWKAGRGAEFNSGVIETPRGRTKVVLLKPMEFMNLSGFAVQRALAFHQTPLDELLILHDDIDLPLGSIRVKSGGGHGGQNGLRSIIDQLGTNKFARIRVGIGRPEHPVAGEKDVAGWVLADFPSSQAAQVERIVSGGADAARAVVGLGVGPAMNDWNGRPQIA